MKFTEAHLTFMLRLRDRCDKFTNLSATRKSQTLELKSVRLLKEDDEGYIFTTELGDNLIEHLIVTAQKCITEASL